MKRVLQIAGIAITALFLYLIVVYFIRNTWSDFEVRLAILGFIISIPLLFYKFFKRDR